jgi:L-aspartate semialdehyde sulfurtransferase ferredoxin
MDAIDIRVDDKACVGCSLCVDECPTKVFEMKDGDAAPKVRNAGECFGCLSCSEICPATAIEHRNVHLSESYYHDRQAIGLSEKIGAGRQFNIPKDSAHLQKAVDDLGIRLLSVASVLKQTLGQSLPSVGTMAGMSLATQLPRYQPPRTFDDSLKLLVSTFAPAWAMKPELADNTLTIAVSDCFVREVCSNNKIELGGDICKLFSNYFVGYLGKISRQRPRLMTVTPSQEKCVYTLKLYDSK